MLMSLFFQSALNVFSSSSLICVVAGVLLVITLVLTAALRIAPEHVQYVVFRLGRFVGVQGPGMLLVIPIVDKAIPVDLRERVRKLERAPVLTREQAQLLVDVTWIYQVKDPAKSVLEVEDLENSAGEMMVSVLRTVFSGMDLHQALSSHPGTAAAVQQQLGEIISPWGVALKRVDVRDVRKV